MPGDPPEAAALDSEAAFSRRHLADVDRPVQSGDRQPCAVGVKGEVGDRGNPLQLDWFLPPVYLVHGDLAIGASQRQLTAVRTEADRSRAEVQVRSARNCK